MEKVRFSTESGTVALDQNNVRTVLTVERQTGSLRCVLLTRSSALLVGASLQKSSLRAVNVLVFVGNVALRTWREGEVSFPHRILRDVDRQSLR